MKFFEVLFLCSYIFFSQNLKAQWSNSDFTLTGREILCFAKKGSSMLAGTNGGLVVSTNNGQSWTNTGGGLPYQNVRALLNVESYSFDILAGLVSGRISMSTNYGENWTGFPIDSVQLPFLADINCILEKSNSSNFLIGTERGAYLLPQYYPLSSWISINTGLPSGETKVRAIVENNGEVFVGTNSGVFRLNGFSWVEKNSGLTNTNVTTLTSFNGNLFAGTAQGSVGGVYVSTDNGDSWILSLNDGWVTSLFNIGSSIFAGSFGNGVWRSTNNGTSWSQINDGFGGGAYYVMSLGADNQYLFAGTSASSIWRRPLSQVVTDINDEIIAHPSEFLLGQNYPNPFNPITKIKWQSPESGHQTLKIYDVLGNEVATLVDEIKPAGSYEIDFNASQFSSGLYIYTFQAAKFTSTKKMILIK